MRRVWLLAAFAVITIIVLAAAWIDGGREAVRPMVTEVPIPPAPILGASS